MKLNLKGKANSMTPDNKTKIWAAIIAGIFGCLAATIVLGQPIVDRLVDIYVPLETPAVVQISTPPPTNTPRHTATPAPTPTVMTSIDTLVGTWEGIEQVTWEGEEEIGWKGDVIIIIKKLCRVGADCGTLDFPTVPCSTRLSLQAIEEETFRFQRKDVTGEGCSLDAQDLLQPLADGTLLYTGIGSDWEGKGILQKTGD
ncbi:MAG: hypothetical protein GY797_16760 [Deltaproteobacteria bacterium]|nr:hypothetical protein [Deltaproteobacteria bacterium]